MAGKKRSRKNRIGDLGEAAFRTFGHQHRILPNKVENDYGIDFLCQWEGREDAKGTAGILGGLFNAFVRATSGARKRIVLRKRDIESLLSCTEPVLIAGLHRPGTPEEVVLYRFLDEELALIFMEALDNKRKTKTLAPPILKSGDQAFLLDLETAMKPGTVEELHLKMRQHRLRKTLPGSRIQIQRAESGSLTIIEIRDFLSQFMPKSKEEAERFHLAAFGAPDLFYKRIKDVSVLPDLIEAMSTDQGIIVGPMGEEVEVVVQNGGRRTACKFDVRVTPKHMGWVHKSGLSLLIDRTPVLEGTKHVHKARVSLDPAIPLDTNKHPDLEEFLRECEAESELHFPGKLPPVSVLVFDGLFAMGAFVRYRPECEADVASPPGFWDLSALPPEETLQTMGLLNYVRSTPNAFEKFAFLAGPYTEKQCTKKEAVVEIPIYGNVAGGAFVVMLTCRIQDMKYEGGSAGLRVTEVLDRSILRLDHRLEKVSIYPEILVAYSLATVVLGPKKVRGTTASPEKWPHSIRYVPPPEK